MGDNRPPSSERITREDLRGEVGGAAKSYAVVVVEGEAAMVLDLDEADSRRPPTSQKETLRFLLGIDVLVSLGLGIGLITGISSAVLRSESSLPRLLTTVDPGK